MMTQKLGDLKSMVGLLWIHSISGFQLLKEVPPIHLFTHAFAYSFNEFL